MALTRGFVRKLAGAAVIRHFSSISAVFRRNFGLSAGILDFPPEFPVIRRNAAFSSVRREVGISSVRDRFGQDAGYTITPARWCWWGSAVTSVALFRGCVVDELVGFHAGADGIVGKLD